METPDAAQDDEQAVEAAARHGDAVDAGGVHGVLLPVVEGRNSFIRLLQRRVFSEGCVARAAPSCVLPPGILSGHIGALLPAISPHRFFPPSLGLPPFVWFLRCAGAFSTGPLCSGGPLPNSLMLL